MPDDAVRRERIEQLVGEDATWPETVPPAGTIRDVVRDMLNVVYGVLFHRLCESDV